VGYECHWSDAVFGNADICQDTDIAVLEKLCQVCQKLWAKGSAMKTEEKKAYETEILEEFHKRQKEYQAKHLNADTGQEQGSVSFPQPQTVWQRIKAKTCSEVTF
jgi:polyhydroxyalkanoate synthesis regulator phasin